MDGVDGAVADAALHNFSMHSPFSSQETLDKRAEGGDHDGGGAAAEEEEMDDDGCGSASSTATATPTEGDELLGESMDLGGAGGLSTMTSPRCELLPLWSERIQNLRQPDIDDLYNSAVQLDQAAQPRASVAQLL
eukprot:RCo003956